MLSRTAQIENIAGQGRALILVYEQDGRFEDLAGQISYTLEAKLKVCLISITSFHEYDWQERAQSLEQVILESKLKNASIVGFGSASALVIHLCLAQPKLIRSLILIDATTRPHPGRLTRIIDRIENVLPAGLPFRSFNRTFNAKPFLQRIRCPAAVITTANASAYHQAEANTFKSLLPTAWTKSMAASDLSVEIPNFIIEFQQVAAKRPQKNIEKIFNLS